MTPANPNRLHDQYSSDRPPRTSFLPFGRPLLEEEDIAEVVATLRSGWIGTGPRAQALENEFKRITGAAHAVALNSCTAALHLGLVAAGAKPGTEVITTSMTFAATVNAIWHTGARPILVDVDEKTMNLDPELVEAAITDKTIAIVAVDFAGRPCEWEKLRQIANHHDLVLVDDAAHALGASLNGKPIGSLADITCFSFYANKNVTTAEGGMLVTDRGDWYDRIASLSLHGLSAGAWNRFGKRRTFEHYEVAEPGYKYNMPDLAAALALGQLRRFEANQHRRHEIWTKYNSGLQNLPIKLPAAIPPGVTHAYHLYTVRVTEESQLSRDELATRLLNENIGVGVHYRAIHLQEFYRQALNCKQADFPAATKISNETLSLPISPAMTTDDIEDVLDAVHRVL